MIAVWDQPRLVEAFVSMGLWGDLRGVGECQAVGFADDAGLRAGVLFHNWQPETGVIEVTAYSTDRRWMTRGRLMEMFDYVFVLCRCQMLVARTAEDNKTALRFWSVLGAQEYRIPRLLGRDRAEIISTLTDEQWQAFADRARKKERT